MEALQLAARMIMENGGETYRAEETVCRMGEGFGLREVESFAVPSGVFVSYRTTEGRLETGVRRVRRQDFNLTRVDEVNKISRQVAEGRLTAPVALKKLLEVEELRGPMPGAWGLFSAAVCAAGFAFLFGGGFLEAACGAVIASLIQGLLLLLRRFQEHGIAGKILGGLFTALLPSLAGRFLPGLLVDTVIAAALMPLVPGVAMANAVQDTLRGDLISGLSHGVQALLTACLIAGGALLSPILLRFIP